MRLVTQARSIVRKFQQCGKTVECGDVFDKWAKDVAVLLADVERFVEEKTKALVGDAQLRCLFRAYHAYDPSLVEAWPGIACSVAQAIMAEALLVRQLETDVKEMVASLRADPLAHVTRRYQSALEIAGEMSLWRCARCASRRFGAQKPASAASCRSTARKVRLLIDEFVELLTATLEHDLPREEVIERWCEAKADVTDECIGGLKSVERMVVVKFFASNIVGRLLEERRSPSSAAAAVKTETKTPDLKTKFQQGAETLVGDFISTKIDLIIKLEEHVKAITTHDDQTGHYVEACFAENIARLETPAAAAAAPLSFSRACAFSESVLDIHKATRELLPSWARATTTSDED